MAVNRFQNKNNPYRTITRNKMSTFRFSCCRCLAFSSKRRAIAASSAFRFFNVLIFSSKGFFSSCRFFCKKKKKKLNYDNLNNFNRIIISIQFLSVFSTKILNLNHYNSQEISIQIYISAIFFLSIISLI